MKLIEEAKNQQNARPTVQSLYQNQRDLLETFLSKGAISRAEYEKGIRLLAPAMQCA
ncbi:MAG: hypothetical protein Q4F31_03530 [Eubacteriales bacterium]|nr:hypothetical protein [Eubacteriales bacterium]